MSTAFKDSLGFVIDQLDNAALGAHSAGAENVAIAIVDVVGVCNSLRLLGGLT